MWIEKTPEELEEDAKRRQRKADKYGFFSFFGFLGFMVLKDKFIGPGGTAGADLEKPISWEEIYSNLFFYVILASFFGFAVYKTIKYKRSGAMICPACGKPASTGKSLICSCGEELKELDKMKWIDS
ncbi:MAG: hypothetical protein KDC05_02760 [Bacteroidales bacterium]|nr:hypothetical protein [Bacteroidales bacterium]